VCILAAVYEMERLQGMNITAWHTNHKQTLLAAWLLLQSFYTKATIADCVHVRVICAHAGDDDCHYVQDFTVSMSVHLLTICEGY